MEVDVNISFIFYIFSLFLVFRHDFFIIIDFTHVDSSKQLMTSQVRSHTVYLIQTYNIILLSLYSKLMRNVLIRFNDDS